MFLIVLFCYGGRRRGSREWAERAQVRLFELCDELSAESVSWRDEFSRGRVARVDGESAARNNALFVNFHDMVVVSRGADLIWARLAKKADVR